MIGRRQLAVASPISIAAVLRAFTTTLGDAHAVRAHARALVAARFDVPTVLLTDSGTSALVLALRMAVPAGGIVGFPAYACVDLTAAALRAGVRVRLYDLDPSTLGPDMASVEHMLGDGVDAIVVAHLYGYPADVPGIRALAARAGVPVIEDAAQGAGATLHGQRLGTHGDLGVLSFGRGKGLCAGGGGALLGVDPRWDGAITTTALPAPSRGSRNLAVTAIQWALGRPSLYALPSMLPWLRLGEMVYHEAHEPESMTLGSSALVESALALEAGDVEARRRHARAHDHAVAGVSDVGATLPVPGAAPSYLRYAVRDVTGRRAPSPTRGILRAYPLTLAEQRELRPILVDASRPIPGATTLRNTLFTLPTHRHLRDTDLADAGEWLLGDARRVASQTSRQRPRAQ
jgi:hypothetical protein